MDLHIQDNVFYITVLLTRQRTEANSVFNGQSFCNNADETTEGVFEALCCS